MSSVHSPEYQRFLRRLRRARLDAGLSQAEVARAIRKPQSFMSKSESGERRLDVIELAAIARLYRRSLDDFVR